LMGFVSCVPVNSINQGVFGVCAISHPVTEWFYVLL
jgi:hypothetical protein